MDVSNKLSLFEKYICIVKKVLKLKNTLVLILFTKHKKLGISVLPKYVYITGLNNFYDRHFCIQTCCDLHYETWPAFCVTLCETLNVLY